MNGLWNGNKEKEAISCQRCVSKWVNNRNGTFDSEYGLLWTMVMPAYRRWLYLGRMSGILQSRPASSGYTVISAFRDLGLCDLDLFRWTRPVISACAAVTSACNFFIASDLGPYREWCSPSDMMVQYMYHIAKICNAIKKLWRPVLISLL